MSYLDPRTKQCQYEIQRILHIQNIANQPPDAFSDTAKITKSHIPAANALAKIDVPKGSKVNIVANESKARQKRGRPIGSKDLAPRKRKSNEKSSINEPPEEVINDQKNHSNENLNSPRSVEGNIISEEIKEDSNDKMAPNNNEISIFYTNYGET